MRGGGTTQRASATIWFQVAFALFVLVVGTLVYVLDRSGDSVPFFSLVNIAHLLPSIFGRMGDSLPTFAHAFAFSVLTAVWLGGHERARLSACLMWFGIDTAFEAGQHPQVAERLAQFVPGWFEHLPILEQADSYFLSGTFDAGDLISIAAGAAAAYLMTGYTVPKDLSHE